MAANLALLPYIFSNFDDDNVGVNITTTITIVTWTESSLSFSEEEEEEEGWSFKPCLDATMVTSNVSTSTMSNKALSKFGRGGSGRWGYRKLQIHGHCSNRQNPKLEFEVRKVRIRYSSNHDVAWKNGQRTKRDKV